jgi:hypothetical protein
MPDRSIYNVAPAAPGRGRERPGRGYYFQPYKILVFSMGILSLKILRLRITNFKAENTITVFRKAPAGERPPRKCLLFTD